VKLHVEQFIKENQITGKLFVQKILDEKFSMTPTKLVKADLHFQLLGAKFY